MCRVAPPPPAGPCRPTASRWSGVSLYSKTPVTSETPSAPNTRISQRTPARRKHDRFLDVRARQHRRARAFERQGDRARPVAVRVGLDDGDDAGPSGSRFRGLGFSGSGAPARRTLTCEPGTVSPREEVADRAEVVGDGVEVDVGDGRSNHAIPDRTREPVNPVSPAGTTCSGSACARAGTRGSRCRWGRCAAWR